MTLQIQVDLEQANQDTKDLSQLNPRSFSKDYGDFLNESGWRLEKKLPSNSNHYSDLLEDTDWNYNKTDSNSSKHYRRDLDALS